MERTWSSHTSSLSVSAVLNRMETSMNGIPLVTTARRLSPCSMCLMYAKLRSRRSANLSEKDRCQSAQGEKRVLAENLDGTTGTRAECHANGSESILLPLRGSNLKEATLTSERNVRLRSTFPKQPPIELLLNFANVTHPVSYCMMLA